MARQVRVFLVDDIDGTSDAQTIEFSIGRDGSTIRAGLPWVTAHTVL